MAHRRLHHASAAAIGWFASFASFGQPYPAPAPVFSNVFGGRSGIDVANAAVVDSSGNVVVVGTTSSPDFPVTHAYQPGVAHGAVVAISANGISFPSLGGAVDVNTFASSADGSVVLALSDSGIFRSGDGGATWTQQLPGLPAASTMAIDGSNVNTIYASIPPDLSGRQSIASGFYKSADGGQTWARVPSSPNMSFVASATLSTPSRISGTIYANDNGFFRSRDGGLTWEIVAPQKYNVFSFALAPASPDVVYTVASDGLVYRSNNGGDTWTATGGMFAAYPNTNSNLYNSALAVDPRDANIVWAVTSAGNLSKSIDGGATFSTVLSDPAAGGRLSISPSGRNIISGVLGSFDGGVTWHKVFSGIVVHAVLAGEDAIFVGTHASQQAFLTKWSADGSRMIFSTFLESAGPIVADSSGNIYVAGGNLIKFNPGGDALFSLPLPGSGPVVRTITIDSFDNVYVAVNSQYGAGSAACSSPQAQIMKFDPQGDLIYLRCLDVGGYVFSIAVDNLGALYLAGNAGSQSLPTTPTAIQPTAPAAPPSNYPFYFSSGYGFLAVLSPQADQVRYLSYIGGGSSAAYGVALDAAGNVYVTGFSIDFAVPFTPSATFRAATSCPIDSRSSFAFVVKLNPSSATPAWFSEIGGGCSWETAGAGLAVDASGDVWVGGETPSGLFPTLAPFEVQGTDEGFLFELSPDGQQLLLSSYLAGHFALGPRQTLAVAGIVTPNPPKQGVFQLGSFPTSALVQKFDLSATRSAVIDAISSIHPPGIDNHTQLLGIAPGEMVRIIGRGLGPDTTVGAQFDVNGRVAASLGGTRVLFDGVPAPLISVQDSAILCMTPFEVSGNTSTSVQIERNGVAMPGVIVGVKEVTLTPDVLVVANADWTLNSESNPARAGELVTLYVTGFGGTNPAVPDGSIYRSPLPIPSYPFRSSAYAGPAPGLVAGIWQVNVVAPPLGANQTNPLEFSLLSPYHIGAYTPGAFYALWVTQ